MRDRDNKTSSMDATLLAGYVASYDPVRKVYLVRSTKQNSVPITCPALDVGVDIPFAQGTKVALHFYPDYGYVIVGRLPDPLAQVALTPQQPDDAEPKESSLVTFRDALDKDERFYAQPGDMDVVRGPVRLFLSRVGAIALKVSATCMRYMSTTYSTIKDVCFTYIRSQPGSTFISTVDTKQDSPTVGQPQLSLEVVPTDNTNTMLLKLGGGVTDTKADGMDLVFGQLVRLLLRLVPANPMLEYTHGTNRTKIQIDLQQFLLQFGSAKFTWSDTGLLITQGTSKLSMSAADVLEIVSASLTILLSGKLDLKAASLKVDAPAEFSTPVRIQGFDALTVYTTLNALILAFNTHNHLLGPLPTTVPVNAGAVTPVIPTTGTSPL